MSSGAAASSVSFKDLATTGVAVAASLAALYSVLSLSVRLDLAQDERDRRQQRLKSSQSPRRPRRRKPASAAAKDQSVGPDQRGAAPGDSALLAPPTDHSPLPAVPPPSLASNLPPASSFLLGDSSSAALSTDPDSALLRVSQLDQPTLDSELARTDAKLRRLLKRKEKLELRRNQLSVAQLRSASTAMEPEPTLFAESYHQPSITPSVAGPAGSHIRRLTPDERALFGLPPMGDGMPMPPSAEGRESYSGDAAAASGRTRRESITAESFSTSTGSTYSAAAAGASEQGPGVHPHAALVSSMSSEHNELDAAAASSSGSSSAAVPDAEEGGDDDFVEDDDQDDDSDVLSSISDASAGLESVVSDTSLGSDFSFLSDARYGLFHQHG